MGLVNVVRREHNSCGQTSWELLDLQGMPIAAFDAYCKTLNGLSYSTRRRYAIVVSRFIDYLYESQMLGPQISVSRSVINTAIDWYLILLRDGNEISLSTKKRNVIVYEEGDEEREKRLREIAARLRIIPLSRNSWSNTLAPLNKFLRLCMSLAEEAKEILAYRSNVNPSLITEASWDPRPLLTALEGVSTYSVAEINHIKSSSMLGAVIPFRGEELTRPRGLRRSARQILQVDLNSLDFPESFFPALLEAATSWRDRALWTLEYASGVRRSEALNLRWADIEMRTRQVHIVDPELKRFGRDGIHREKETRFKGRTVSWTYLRTPYRDWFFDYLMMYRKQEYCIPPDGNDYVFQYLISPYFGRPLLQASDESLNSAFKSAVLRAGVPGPAIAPNYVWTSHSLRHGYAKFMKNDYRLPGSNEPGLTDSEVQLLLGHKDINTTKKYGKLRDERIKEKLDRNDKELFSHYIAAPMIVISPLSGISDDN